MFWARARGPWAFSTSPFFAFLAIFVNVVRLWFFDGLDGLPNLRRKMTEKVIRQNEIVVDNGERGAFLALWAKNQLRHISFTN